MTPATVKIVEALVDIVDVEEVLTQLLQKTCQRQNPVNQADPNTHDHEIFLSAYASINPERVTALFKSATRIKRLIERFQDILDRLRSQIQQRSP